MYIINNVVDGKTYRLHDQRDQKLRVIEPRLIMTLNMSGGLTFRIPPDHMYYNTIKKMRSSIQVIEDGELIYEGRALDTESDFHNIITVACEGSMAYLLDSVQRPFSITGNIHDFLAEMIKRHNEQVEERKQFLLGRVNVADQNNELKRESTRLDNSWNTIIGQLIERHGGYLWVEYKDGKKYLNYTYDYGGINEQQIRFGVNLLDLTKYQDAADVVTRLIPYGGEAEYQDELGETQTRMTDITSVNDGKDYIMADQSVIDEFGQITGTCQWTDITDPAKLLEKARDYLKNACVIPDSLQLSAVDLNYTGVDIRRFRVGYYTKAVSKPHGIDKNLLLARLDMYLDDPGKGSISLGTTVESFTSSTVNKQISIAKAVEDSENKTFDEMERKIANATNLITGGFGGYVILDNMDPATGKKMHPWRILVMNTPDKDTATNVIQINQNGIGFSTTGINGPYRNAWTIDGNLVADFITTGTMLCDRLRGGTLELGGTGLGRDGKITIYSASGALIGTIDKTGVKFRNGIYTGGSLDIGCLQADEDGCQIGDYYVGADGGNVLRSTDGTVTIQTAKGGPFGKYAAISLSSDSGTTILSDHHLQTPFVDAKQINGECKLLGDNWWRNYTIFGALDYLYNKIESLE